MNPNLFLNSAEIEEIKQKIERYSWSRQAFASMKTRADEWAARSSITVPETAGGL